MVGSKILSITGTELHRRILPCIEYAEFQGGTNEGSGGSGSLSSDGFTEAVTQVDRTTVVFIRSRGRLQDKEDR